MLKLEHIYKSFPIPGEKDAKNVIFDDFSFELKDHEFITVIGGNGSGKSTLLNIISGALLPDQGKISIDDIDVTKMNEHKRAKYIGRVFQDPMIGTCGDMSVIENLELAYRRGKRHSLRWGFKKENKQLFIEKLKQFNLGLEDRLNQKVGLLSGGQRQALTLLMATLQKPSFLLLDEHTAALDPGTSKKVMDITSKMVEENNLTTIMITHKMSDAIKYGTRLIMINRGKIVLDLNEEKKKKLTPEQLHKLFADIQDQSFEVKL